METIFFTLKRLDEIEDSGDELPLHILEHCMIKQDEKDFHTSVLSYCLLKKILTEFNVDIEELRFSKNGKPLINKGYISLSHSKDYVLVSYSLINHGVDLQSQDKIKNNDKIIHRYFKEYLDSYLIEDEEVKNSMFYKLWTLKECVTKKNDSSIFEMNNFQNLYTFSTEMLLENKMFTLSFVSDFSFQLKELHF